MAESGVDVGLEIDFLRDAVEVCASVFLMPFTLVLSSVLAIGRDALLHLGTLGAVYADHRHHRNVDLREDVLRHDHDGRNAEETE